MRKILPVLLIAASAVIVQAQEAILQPGHTHDILAVRFSPDDSQLISYSAADRRMCLWDIWSGRLVWRTNTGFVQKCYEPSNLEEFFWSEDGRFIVTRSMNGSWQTWDAKTGRILSSSDTEPGIRPASPRRKALDVVEDGADLVIRDPENKLVRRFRSSAGLRYSATSHDGTLLAEADIWPGHAIKITDISSSRSRRLGAHPDAIGSLGYAPGGTTLAAGGGDGTIYLFDASSHHLIVALTGYSEPVVLMRFGPDGRRLISCDRKNRLVLWDVAAGLALAEDFAGHPPFGSGAVRRIDWSPDGKTILTVREDEIRLWKAENLKPDRTLKVKERYETRPSHKGLAMIWRFDTMPVIDAVFAEDGRKIIAEYADGSLRVWDVRSGKQIRRFRPGAGHRTIRLSSDAKTILARAPEYGKGPLKILDAENGKDLAFFDLQGMGVAYEFVVSPDGKHAAASLYEPLVLVWAIDNPKPLHVLDMGSDGSSALAFSPDGKALAAGGGNQNLMLFDVASGAKLWQLIPDDPPPSELEVRLLREQKERRDILDGLEAKRDERAAAETPVFEKQVYITFEHYGVMKNPGSLRFSESGEPDKSRLRTTAEKAEAVWLRLHNDSPLPISVLASVPYLNAMTCEYKFAEGDVVRGLSPDREIQLDLDFEDKNGNPAPPFYDNSFGVNLLPKTSLLFAIPLQYLREGQRFTLRYSFQNVLVKGGRQAAFSMDYGTKKALTFSLADIK